MRTFASAVEGDVGSYPTRTASFSVGPLHCTDAALADLDSVYPYVAQDSTARADTTLDSIPQGIGMLREIRPSVAFYRIPNDETAAQIVRIVVGRHDLHSMFFEQP